MMSVLCVAISWVVNASSGEKSCLQFSIPTGSEAGGEGGVSHRLNNNSIAPKFQLGEVNLADVEYVVAHPNIMAEILLLKGLLKRKYPTPSAGMKFFRRIVLHKRRYHK